MLSVVFARDAFLRIAIVVFVHRVVLALQYCYGELCCTSPVLIIAPNRQLLSWVESEIPKIGLSGLETHSSAPP